MNITKALDKSEARRQRWKARSRYWKDSFILWRRNRLMVVGTGITWRGLCTTEEARAYGGDQ